MPVFLVDDVFVGLSLCNSHDMNEVTGNLVVLDMRLFWFIYHLIPPSQNESSSV